MNAGAPARIEAVVAGVLHQAVRDAGAAGVVVLEQDSPEGTLVRAWCVRRFGDDRVWTAPEVARNGGTSGEPVDEEHARLAARLLAHERNALLLHPANKTALLLASRLPPEPVLPLGDLYASGVAEVTGGWSAPADVRAIVEQAGGVAAVDAALEAYVEHRVAPERAVQHLPERARERILHQLESRRFWRRRAGLVPKLGTRTLGIDMIG